MRSSQVSRALNCAWFSLFWTRSASSFTSVSGRTAARGETVDLDLLLDDYERR